MADSTKLKQRELGHPPFSPKELSFLKEAMTNPRLRLCLGREYKEGVPWKMQP
jgi:hypothetical protein